MSVHLCWILLHTAVVLLSCGFCKMYPVTIVSASSLSFLVQHPNFILLFASQKLLCPPAKFSTNISWPDAIHCLSFISHQLQWWYSIHCRSRYIQTYFLSVFLTYLCPLNPINFFPMPFNPDISTPSLSTHTPPPTHFLHFENKECLGKICVWCHVMHHLQSSWSCINQISFFLSSVNLLQLHSKFHSLLYFAT